jgi:hypothetical protein
VGDAGLRLKQFAAHVGDREVVDRVVRTLPDDDWPRAVGDRLAAEEGAHSLG